MSEPCNTPCQDMCMLGFVECLHACSHTSMVSRGVSPCTKGDSALGVLVTCMTSSWIGLPHIHRAKEGSHQRLRLTRGSLTEHPFSALPCKKDPFLEP